MSNNHDRIPCLKQGVTVVLCVNIFLDAFFVRLLKQVDVVLFLKARRCAAVPGIITHAYTLHTLL